MNSGSEASNLPRQARDVVAGARQSIRVGASVALEGIDHVALLEFPQHGNVGDSAIWLGAQKLLREMDIDVRYAASSNSYDPQIAQRCIASGGAIVMNGGGSFGDIWPASYNFKINVLETFKHTRIIFLPQTIKFTTDDALRAARQLIRSHPSVTILARDERSAAVASDLGCNDVSLCPDLAFMLDLERSAPDIDVIWLLRQDRESTGWAAGINRTQATILDWPEDPYRLYGSTRVTRSVRFRSRRLQAFLQEQVMRRQILAPLAISSLDARAQRRLQGGVALLSQGRVIVTDRLHGHILSLLTAIPHVLADNSYGKVSHYARTWKTCSAGISIAQTPEEASVIARRLLADTW